jgi:hypothetical protein
MREPYIELGLGIVARAILDWREESEAAMWPEEETPYLKNIAKFFNGELAFICTSQVNMDPKIILENLRKENVEKRKELLAGLN